MARVHCLNVRNGACSIIQHDSGRTSVIDVCCASEPVPPPMVQKFSAAENLLENWKRVPGDFDQKSDPDNPIAYLRKIAVAEIFRFILTHPDMDHLDGFADLIAAFPPGNFWDSDNTKELGAFGWRPELAKDWAAYKQIRDTSPDTNPRRLVYYSGTSREYFNYDSLQILAPTKELVAAANRAGDWNDSSYVILFTSHGRRVLFSGDSEDNTWDHILANWKDAISNVDIFIAPHHGRASGRAYDFLATVRPRLTIFGNAPAEHQSYKAYSNRNLMILTHNQAGYIVLDMTPSGIGIYIKNETYARAIAKANNWETGFSVGHDGWRLLPYFF